MFHVSAVKAQQTNPFTLTFPLRQDSADRSVATMSQALRKLLSRRNVGGLVVYTATVLVCFCRVGLH